MSISNNLKAGKFKLAEIENFHHFRNQIFFHQSALPKTVRFKCFATPGELNFMKKNFVCCCAKKIVNKKLFIDKNQDKQKI